MKEYSVSVKVKNNLILQRIHEAGYSSVRQFCLSVGLSEIVVGQLINMKRRAFMSSSGKGIHLGEWTKPAKKLAEALGCLVEDLFTERQACGIGKSHREIKVSERDMLSIAMSSESCADPLSIPDMRPDVDPHHIYDKKDTRAIVNKAIKRLTPREQQVVTLLYGLNGDPDMAEIEVAKALGISRVRVDQCRNTSARKLRRLVGAKLRK